MKKENFSTDQLPLLHKGNICISIIVPTHKLSLDRRIDPLQVTKAIQYVKEYLQNEYASENTALLIQGIDELYGQIDFNHNAAGIGLFVSADIKKLVHFYFPVKEKVIIGDAFETSDWIYQAFYDVPYFVLLLSEKMVMLFNGHLDTVIEINDDHFPKQYKEEYEYSRPSRGTPSVGHAFLKEFEKDKSVLEGIRFENFFRQADDSLNNYLGNGMPLVVIGDTKNLAYFRNITKHDKNIAGYIPGNYNLSTGTELGNLTWQAMKIFLDNEKDKLIDDCKEKIGAGLGITGIQNTWKAAIEGNCFKLLVEKDYTAPGFVKNKGDYHLYLHRPQNTYQVIPDAVNSIIEMVLEKKGEVVIVENDSLKDYERIALITRY